MKDVIHWTRLRDRCRRCLVPLSVIALISAIVSILTSGTVWLVAMTVWMVTMIIWNATLVIVVMVQEDDE